MLDMLYAPIPVAVGVCYACRLGLSSAQTMKIGLFFMDDSRVACKVGWASTEWSTQLRVANF